MRILHVLSQTELTGAEVYAVNLAERQTASGHATIFVSDRIHVPLKAKLYALPISKRSWPQRWKNIREVRRILREEKIDIVHAHSRAASWVAYWATKGKGVGYVSTVHGRQHLHASLRLYDIYGDRVIAICENLRRHLNDEVGMRVSKITTIPNGVDGARNLEDRALQRKRILLVGRSSGPKGERAGHVIKNIFPGILENYPAVEIGVVGGLLRQYDAETRATLQNLLARYPGRFEVREQIFEQELALEFGRSSLIIGSGRLAIQGLLSGKATIALGEATCHGLLSPKNFQEAVKSNFGDILPALSKKVNYDLVREGIDEHLADGAWLAGELAGVAGRFFSPEKMVRQVEEVYFDALCERRLPKRVPVLMYHKVVDEKYSSEHKTYIAEEKFRRHLQTLRRHGRSPVTFSDLRDAAIGTKKLPRRPLVLTFDDGYRRTCARALPLLNEFGFRAVFYVLGDAELRYNNWDKPDSEAELISADELLALKKSGMEIGAHSMTHRPFSDLGEQELEWELLESKKSLETVLGEEILSFAYPFGNLSNQAKEAVRNHGFKFAVATDSGGLSLAEDRMQIFRVSIFPQDGAFQLRKKVSSFYRDYYFLKRGK